MKLLLPFKGSRMDYQSLTAVPSRVRKGKKFKGAGSDQTQTGTLEVISAVQKELTLNGRYDIPAGLYDGTSTVKQTTVATMEGVTVYPTGQNQTVNTENKYITTRDVKTAPLTGLSPENIKKGVTILGVTGTYEGYQ